ncbi:gly-3, partial [Symbiodinium necroappetens]
RVPSSSWVCFLPVRAELLVVDGLISLAIELYRQRRRCLPYPVYLVLVYAVQILCCLPSLHSSLSLEIPRHGSATAATISIAARLNAA